MIGLGDINTFIFLTDTAGLSDLLSYLTHIFFPALSCTLLRVAIIDSSQPERPSFVYAHIYSHP